MTDDRISQVEQESARLRKEIAELRQMMITESNIKTEYIAKIYKDITDIYNSMARSNNWLTTLIYRVMPEYANVRDQIEGILGLKPPTTPDTPV